MSESIIGEYIPCKRCGDLFDKMTWNQVYCSLCKNAHHNEQAARRWYAKHGGRRPRKSHDWSDWHRFKFYMEKTWQSAVCPICGAHMSNDPCSSDQVQNPLRITSVDTWHWT